MSTSSSMIISSSSAISGYQAANSIPISPEPEKDLFFKCHETRLIQIIHKDGTYPFEIAQIIAAYITSEEDIFGAKEWKFYYGVQVKNCEINFDEFYKFWFGPDPIDSTKQVYATHLPPVLQLQNARWTDISRTLPLNLPTFSTLIERPAAGYPTLFNFPLTIDQIIDLKDIKAEENCFIVMRKESPTLNKTYNEQIEFIRNLNKTTQIGYEETPSAFSISLAVVANYTRTSERYLGDHTGKKSRPTYSRCKTESHLPNNSICVGNFSARAGFGVYLLNNESLEKRTDDCVLAVLRKFKIIN